jgi:hypothetical protein
VEVAAVFSAGGGRQRHTPLARSAETCFTVDLWPVMTAVDSLDVFVKERKANQKLFREVIKFSALSQTSVYCERPMKLELWG